MYINIDENIIWRYYCLLVSILMINVFLDGQRQWEDILAVGVCWASTSPGKIMVNLIQPLRYSWHHFQNPAECVLNLMAFCMTFTSALSPVHLCTVRITVSSPFVHSPDYRLPFLQDHYTVFSQKCTIRSPANVNSLISQKKNYMYIVLLRNVSMQIHISLQHNNFRR